MKTYLRFSLKTYFMEQGSACFPVAVFLNFLSIHLSRHLLSLVKTLLLPVIIIQHKKVQKKNATECSSNKFSCGDS